MSHKTMISGTAYEVVGGAQMIDGTKFQMGGVKRLSAERRSTYRFRRAFPLEPSPPARSCT